MRLALPLTAGALLLACCVRTASGFAAPTTMCAAPRRAKAAAPAGGGAGLRYRGPGFRVVRCFPALSRRAADQAVVDGRVTVNGAVARPSRRIKGGDAVELDGKRVEWEVLR